MNYFPSELIKRNIHRAPKGSTVLDVGCGNGRNSLFLSAIGFTVIAIDKSKERVDEVIQAGNVQEVINCSIEDYIFKHTFEVIVAMNVLQFVERPQEIIAKLKDNCTDLIFINVFSDKTPISLQTKGVKYFNKNELVSAFSDWNIIVCNEYHVTEIHPPLGLHAHDCIELIAKKI
jgi:tellurite methyltransferase